MRGDKSADRFVGPKSVFPIWMMMPPTGAEGHIARGQAFGFPKLVDDFRNGHLGRTVGIKGRGVDTLNNF